MIIFGAAFRSVTFNFGLKATGEVQVYLALKKNEYLNKPAAYHLVSRALTSNCWEVFASQLRGLFVWIQPLFPPPPGICKWVVSAHTPTLHTHPKNLGVQNRLSCGIWGVWQPWLRQDCRTCGWAKGVLTDRLVFSGFVFHSDVFRH